MFFKNLAPNVCNDATSNITSNIAKRPFLGYFGYLTKNYFGDDSQQQDLPDLFNDSYQPVFVD